MSSRQAFNSVTVRLLTSTGWLRASVPLTAGSSLVEHLVTGGRPTYLVEYGQVSFKDRALGVEHWVDEVLPEAVRAVHEHSGGRGVHLVGWSLGGIFALLVARIELLRSLVPTLPHAELVTYPRLGHGLKPVLDDALDRATAFLEKV